MKRFAITSMLAGGLFASLLGASGVAHADWEDTIYGPGHHAPTAHAPRVDNRVHNHPVIGHSHPRAGHHHRAGHR